MKKGVKSGQGIEDTTESAIDTAEGVADAAEGFAEGVKETVNVVKGGIDETADAFEELQTRSRILTPIGAYLKKEKMQNITNRDDDESGGKEPMNPEEMAVHEPTAVKRDENRGTSGDPV